MKEFFTTGEVSKICGTAHRTVVNYCEQGRIRNEKSPVTHYRRISREALLEFMAEHGIPMSAVNVVEGKRVLIADDDPTIRLMVRKVLELTFENVEISAVGNGFDALIQAASWKPDLLILDIAMPRIDGFEVCRRLRASESTKGTAILAITGLTQENVRLQAEEAGVNGFLLKPLNMKMLVDSVSESIQVLPMPNSPP